MKLITAANPPASPLATLHYVIRAPHGATRDATIDAVAAGAGTTVRGSFDDAIRAAQLLAAQPAMDGIHRQPINQAHGVLLGANEQWSVVPLVGDHRGRVGPVFVDGAFFGKTALAVWARRGDPVMQAIVGADSLIDLRKQQIGRITPLPPATLPVVNVA